MRDCKYCMNQRVLLNAYGVEERCPACKEFYMDLIDQAVAMRVARAAAEKFVRELGKQRKKEVS